MYFKRSANNVTITGNIIGNMNIHFIHWEFQEPKLEVPTIYKAHFSGLREYPRKIWSKIW